MENEINENEKDQNDDELLEGNEENDFENEPEDNSYKNNKLINYFNEKNQFKFIKNKFDEIRFEIESFSNQLLDIFGKNENGSLLNTLFQIKNEIKYLKYVKNYKNKFLIIILSKRCYCY